MPESPIRDYLYPRLRFPYVIVAWSDPTCPFPYKDTPIADIQLLYPPTILK